jgi:hypothetical protein
MVRASQEFDQRLFELKLSELSREMQIRSRSSYNKKRAASQGTGRSYLMDVVDCQLSLLRDEWLNGVDRIAREVWQIQGKALSPAFARDVLVSKAIELIGVREGVIKSALERARRFDLYRNPYPAQHNLAMKIMRLRAEVTNRYEIEACELEYRNTPMERSVTEQEKKSKDGSHTQKAFTVSSGIIPGQVQGLSRGDWPAPTDATNSTTLVPRDSWKDFHERFMQLANEEERIERASPKDRLLRAYCDYKKRPEIWAEKGKSEQGPFCLLKAPETGLWMLGDGVNENFQERFRALAARTGVALGPSESTDPEDFWLHRLYLDLMENNSDQLFAASNEGGMILRVCVASATFCSRLERKAVTEAGRLTTSEKHVESSRAQNNAKLTQSLEGKSKNSTASTEKRVKRLSATVNSPIAARKLETYLDAKGIGLTDFASRVGTTDRTLRSFRKCGKVRRDIFESIAKHMGTTKEVLLGE